MTTREIYYDDFSRLKPRARKEAIRKWYKENLKEERRKLKIDRLILEKKIDWIEKEFEEVRNAAKEYVKNNPPENPEKDSEEIEKYRDFYKFLCEEKYDLIDIPLKYAERILRFLAFKKKTQIHPRKRRNFLSNKRAYYEKLSSKKIDRIPKFVRNLSDILPENMLSKETKTFHDYSDFLNKLKLGKEMHRKLRKKEEQLFEFEGYKNFLKRTSKKRKEDPKDYTDKYLKHKERYHRKKDIGEVEMIVKGETIKIRQPFPEFLSFISVLANFRELTEDQYNGFQEVIKYALQLKQEEERVCKDSDKD